MKKIKKERVQPFFKKRSIHTHKGSYGRGLIIGGQDGMAGSVTLSSLASLRSGIGLNHLCSEESVTRVVNMHSIETITHPIRSFRNLCELETTLPKLWQDKQVVAFGPGLGQEKSLRRLLELLLTNYTGPVVIDADGLNLVALDPEILHQHNSIILTPHEMEMARLMDCSVEDVSSNRQQIAQDFAKTYQVVVVLKGHETLVTDGKTTYVNTTGNPGMATAGSGDVLTGIIYAHLAKGLAPLDAAFVSVYLHGLSGDLAASDLGEESLIASDLITYLPSAFNYLQS
ncbi:NAD(P)H-hydrate dehydratase [Dolosicoccus paucivorans]|uniref:NAD(P)H-hydrate dehydratase n=1 Tax=Dolosicoccus paucivorans TaxID=84521 RepID=UPI0015E08F11|nr:NAD(P)H-hydrate dehydratase [Dolosicoccus paucivorans]